MIYLYTFSWYTTEAALCQMEMRAFFGQSTVQNILLSDIAVEPSRSPFIRTRLEVLYEAPSIEQLCHQLNGFRVEGTYRVESLNDLDLGATPKERQPVRREWERKVALAIDGEPELIDPERLFGVVKWQDTFYFGPLAAGKAVWLAHQERPHQYSTALGTKMARALVNIAVPHPDGKTVIDPCCGIGTVLIEALSMGINIVGRDMNWFVTEGSRKNIAHFGYKGEVQLGPIEDVSEHYDAAIIDMPYNLFTHSSEESKQSIINSARRIADRVVFVSSEQIEQQIIAAGFRIIDRCDVRKQAFVRTVFVCH